MQRYSAKHAMLFVSALVMGLTACASSGGTARPSGASANRIVRAELEAFGGQADAYQAVQRLRPRWLQVRSGMGNTSVVLYVDGGRLGGVTELRSLRPSQIEQMEYMSASDATTRFGTGHSGGAVLVTTRR
jgi:hypothetical protein